MIDASLASWLQQTTQVLDPVARFEAAIGTADRWQERYLRAIKRREARTILLLNSRQTGKSTSTACMLYDCLVTGRFALVVAPSQNQSRELVRRVWQYRNVDPSAPAVLTSNQTEIEVVGGGRIVVLPGSEATSRGYSNASVLVLEEACRIEDEVIHSVLPSVDEYEGVVCAITTPGDVSTWFRDMWDDDNDALKIMAKATDMPRMAAKVAFLKQNLPNARFEVEVELNWAESVNAWITREVLDNAVSDVEALRL